MNYKVKKTLKDNKKSMIVIGVVWIASIILLASPIAHSIVNSSNNGIFDFGTFLENIGPDFISFSSITKVFGAEYIGTFLKTTLYVTIFYAILTVIGLFRSKPKSEYTDIEHGSSDWSEGGEQYKILSKHKGILLAQDNYLPVDKRGNVNVLVVGRIRFW